MDKGTKRLFTTGGVLSAILSLSALMGLAGNFNSANAFTPFMVINSLSFVALVFLCVVMFIKRSDILLKIALCFNAVVSIAYLAFDFTLIDLFILISLIMLTANLFFKNITKNHEKFVILINNIVAVIISVVAIIGFNNHIATSISKTTDNFIFDFKKWTFYFVPFVYAIINTSLFIIISSLINNSSLDKKQYKINKLTFLPMIFMGIALIITLICAMNSVIITLQFSNLWEILLIIAEVIAILSLIAFPFLRVLLKRKEI